MDQLPGPRTAVMQSCQLSNKDFLACICLPQTCLTKRCWAGQKLCTLYTVRQLAAKAHSFEVAVTLHDTKAEKVICTVRVLEAWAVEVEMAVVVAIRTRSRIC